MNGTAPFPVVLLSDPAIDFAASNYEAFLRERDPSHLAYADGETPTVFHCRVLTLQERRDVRNKATDPDRFEAAFVRGLVRVTGVYRANGERGDWYREVSKDGKERLVSERDLETLFSESMIQEIGAVIWHRSSLPFRPGCVVTFPLLDISQRALMETRRRPVAASTPSASDKPQHVAPQPAMSDSSSDSAQPTTATVAAP